MNRKRMRPAAILAALGVPALILLGALSLPAPASPSGEGPVRVLIDKDTGYARHAALLAREGMRILGDYGRFVLVEIPARMKAAALPASGVRVRREIGETVRLGNRLVAGSRIAPGLPRLRGPERDDLHLLRLAGPARAEWVEALHALPGVRVLMTLPDDAYLVWLPAGARAALGLLPIDFAEPLGRSDRLSGEVDTGPGLQDVTILFVGSPGGVSAALAAADRSFGSPSAPPRLKGLIAVTLTLPGEAIEEIASWPETVWIEPYGRPEVHDEISALITAGFVSGGRPAGPHYREWLEGQGLGDLSSYIVQIVDTGVDSGGLAKEHPALAGRLAFALDETGEGTPEDCVGHGTHIAGIVAGDPPARIGFRDEAGYELGLGIAPTARIGSSKNFTCDGLGQVTRSYTEILDEAYRRGARISNHSWGAGGASYSALAREFDALVRDVNADPTDGDQPMVVVASVGNRGAFGAKTVDAPALAKNVVAVGGSESYRPSGTDGCGVDPEGADDADEVRRSSSTGPTLDGRVKPDLLAPASHIFSLVSQSERYAGSGLCNDYYPPGQRFYTWTGGSSQATAHVSGAAVLLMADYTRQFGAAPSPAMVKAAMVAGARDLGRKAQVGRPAEEHRPDGRQGWGRIDVSAIVGRRQRAAYDQEDVLTGSGQVVEKGPFRVADPNRPVAVVLSWTDAPGTPAGNSWVNDLDLEVDAGGTIYLGNVLEEGFSVPGGVPDSRNNLEAVFLKPPLPPSLVARVVAVSLPGDGIPSRTGLTDQDFALYLDNVFEVGAEGQVSLDRDTVACGGTAEVRVADRNATGGGSLRVEASSAAEPIPESIDLVESPPGSGLFRGLLHAGGGEPARDGVVQVADGDTITVVYQDRDRGDGLPQASGAAAAAQCSPLVISEVRAESEGSDRAVIAWRTNRPADSRITVSGGFEIRDGVRVTEHRLAVEGLLSCRTYTYAVASTDAAGTTASYPASGTLNFSTASSRTLTLYAEDFEGSAVRWTHSGTDDSWELGTPIAGPGSAHSGSRAWGTNLRGPYGEASDIALLSPPIDIGPRAGAVLAFSHFYDIPLAPDGSGPQDGAWLEVTIDGGATWTVVAPESGYPAQQGPGNPYVPPLSGLFAGASSGWSEARVDLSPFRGNVVRFRFRFWRDPASATPPGAGWFVDDVAVTSLVPCRKGTLTLDASEYGCSGTVRIHLADSDLDRDPHRREIASVTAASGLDAIGVLLTETAGGSGLFSGDVPLSPVASASKLRVEPGGTITVEYADADDGSGGPKTAHATASVPECTPPAPPANPSILSHSAGRLDLQWSDPPDPDLAEVRIHYDVDGPGPQYTGEGALEGRSPVRAEAGEEQAALTGLATCIPHFLSLTAVDALGNESAFSDELVGTPAGIGPCSRARVSIVPAGGLGCSQVPTVRIDDANADPDPLTPGILVASAHSSSDPAALTISLTETGPATGIFLGMLPLSPLPFPGSLHVIEGDSVEVRYADTDAGGLVVARSAVEDCTPPGITGLRQTGAGFGDVHLAWETDEPASFVVDYDLDPGLDLSVSGTALETHHETVLPSIPSCAPIYYRVRATDAKGNTGVLDDAGAPLRTGSAREVVLLFDDFENGAPGWSHGGFLDEWELGAPSAGPPGAWSGTKVWGTDLDGKYEFQSDQVLTSPQIDLRGVDFAVLTFRHWYDIYSSVPGRGLDDGGWVEVSRDGGAHWTYITPEGGYPDVVEGNPWIPFASGVYAGTTPGWSEATFRLDAFSGERIRIRFHLFQDSSESRNVPGFGWYLDDVEVRGAYACHRGEVRFGADSFACGSGSLVVRLSDVDLDTDPARRDGVAVRLHSPSDPSEPNVYLTETGPSTGIFLGGALLSSSGGPGFLVVSEGDVVTVTYQDTDDGTGAPAQWEDQVLIGDCTAPVITGLRSRRVSASEAIVEWETDEPATAEVRLQPGGVVFSRTSLDRRHAILIAGLSACAAVRFEVHSADAGGNRAVASNGGALYPLDEARDIEILYEGFEGAPPGWSHGGVHDEWEYGAPLAGPPGAYAGTGVAGTDLDGDYDKDALRQRGASYLVSPSFSLKGFSAARLVFQHYYDLARDTLGDGAVVEAWDGRRWVTLIPEGTYPGKIRDDHGEGTTGAFTEESHQWVASTFDLGDLLDRETRLRFRLILDHGTTALAPGWFIDEVRVTGVAACRSGLLLLDREAFACDTQAVHLTLADLDLDADPGLVETATVEVHVGGSARDVVLSETGPHTGVFRGELGLYGSSPPGGNAFAAQEGDRLEVIYADADDGSGSPRTVSASAPIPDCDPPEISEVRVERAEDAPSLRIRWLTDEPATTQATLVLAGQTQEYAASDLVTDHRAEFPVQTGCGAYAVTLASTDSLGNTAQVSGPDPPYSGEVTRRRVLFRDDMEGPDPGWGRDGVLNDWERGTPTVGPPGPFSGASVLGTDLDGLYQAGTDSTVISPPIDLRGFSSAALTFWHFYHVFADGSPNAEDDGAWIEVQVQGDPAPRYVEPLTGYPNSIDRDANPPIMGGTGVYAGFSRAWLRAVVDLSPYAGSVIRLRFRLWNDLVEGVINRTTGFGWYLDDVEVATREACLAGPALTAVASGRLVQGASGVPIEITGSGLRAPVLLDPGQGVTMSGVAVASPSRVTARADVAAWAATGPRPLRLVNPDGQEAVLEAGLLVELSPGRADLDGSGAVDGRDLALLAKAFGTLRGDARYSAEADFNGDGAVDGGDLAILASRFGQTTSP